MNNQRGGGWNRDDENWDKKKENNNWNKNGNWNKKSGNWKKNGNWNSGNWNKNGNWNQQNEETDDWNQKGWKDIDEQQALLCLQRRQVIQQQMKKLEQTKQELTHIEQLLSQPDIYLAKNKVTLNRHLLQHKKAEKQINQLELKLMHL